MLCGKLQNMRFSCILRNAWQLLIDTVKILALHFFKMDDSMASYIDHSVITYTLTLAFQLFRTEYRLRTLVDDKPLLHRLSRSCHHTLSPIVHRNRPPVCQRSLLFGLNCLPASGLQLIVLYIIICKTQKLIHR